MIDADRMMDAVEAAARRQPGHGPRALVDAIKAMRPSEYADLGRELAIEVEALVTFTDYWDDATAEACEL